MAGARRWPRSRPPSLILLPSSLHLRSGARNSGGIRPRFIEALVYPGPLARSSADCNWASIRADLNNQAAMNLARFTSGNFYSKGMIDEARIESVTRSSNWVWATWMTVASNTALASYHG